MKRLILFIVIALCLGIIPLPTAVYADEAVTVSGTHILANGHAIILAAGTTADYTVVYLDTNGDGVIDGGDSIQTIVGATGTADVSGYDLSGYYIFGGSGSDLDSSTNITMLGGKVDSIYGGGDNCNVTGNTNITIKGGISDYVYGGSDDGDLIGDTNITISDNGYVNFALVSGSHDGDVTGSTNITISGGSVPYIQGGTDISMNASTLNSNIVISGGEVRRFITGGGCSSTPDGKTYTNITGNTNITISGGLFEGNVIAGAWLGKVGGNTNITISGGTFLAEIRGDSRIGGYVDGTKNIKISGGNINEVKSGTYDTLTDGTTQVYKTTLTLSGISAVTDVSGSLNLGGVASGYALTDVKTTDGGLLTFYLPTGAATALYNSNNYATTVEAFHTNVFASLSTNAGLTTVAALTDATPGAQSGADTTNAIAWDLSVANAKSSLSRADIEVAANATFNLYSNAAFTTEITGASTLPLAVGNTVAYIKVTAQDTTTIKYYAVTITRAAETINPTIISGTLAGNNAYIDILFSEGVYGQNDGSTALTAAKLALTFNKNGGNATNAIISSIKKNDNTTEGSASALIGGETNVRVFLTITGTPNGLETIVIKPTNGSSIFDAVGNSMLEAQTTGLKSINDMTSDIASVSITGFVAPVTGATPQLVGTITAGAATYTVTGLTWAPVNNPYSGATVYTATVELTSAAGNKFPVGGIAVPTANGGGTLSAGVTSGGDLSGNKLNFTVQFPATSAALTYTMTAIANQTMTAVTAGYGAGTQETKTLTITRTGTGDLASLATALSGANAGSFTITGPLVTTLNSGTTSTTFTVKANDGLAVGTYTATVTVSATNMTDVTFTVTQVVNAASGGSSTSITAPAEPILKDIKTQDEHGLENSLQQTGQARIELASTGTAQATITSNILGQLSQMDKPLTIAGQGFDLQFDPASLQASQGDGESSNASVQIGGVAVTTEEQQAILDATPLGESTGIFQVGGQVFNFTAQLSTSSEKLTSFVKPVAVTIDLSDLTLTPEQISQLTGTRLVKNELGEIVPVFLGGTYDPVNKTFTFYTDKFSYYTVLQKNEVVILNLTIGNTITKLNGVDKTIDVPPTLINNRTFVPLRFIGETLGTSFDWDGATKTVTFQSDATKLTLIIGKTIPGMDTPPTIINGRTMVPLRYISETFGAEVMWFPASQSVSVVK